MANQFPEVLPQVESMPTTGWYCQTSGNARRRIVPNSSGVGTEGVFNVKGVPGHTHNSSAVVSVDADYTKYRTTSINVPENVWSVGAMNLPVGLLTDSTEPANSEERCERAIERCVGYMSLFPENCTGHIREPTKSIGEIRTLVAPKAQLDTLTYIDEMGGWRVPASADDEAREQELLISEFPDVQVAVLPRSVLDYACELTPEVSPSSLYIDFDSGNSRYVVDSDPDNAVLIGYNAREYRLYLEKEAIRAAALVAQLAAPLDADLQLQLAAAEAAANQALTDAEWDNTLRFEWDADRRLYTTGRPVSIVLNQVSKVAKTAEGGGHAGGGIDAGASRNIRFSMQGNPDLDPLTVTFPVLETTPAFDGFCWLSSLNNEEALGYASATNGLALSPNIDVEVLGADTIGPFRWVGMPAIRIPVGGQYALPGPDIVQEVISQPLNNFYSKFSSMQFMNTLRYHKAQQDFENAYRIDNTIFDARRPEALDFQTRSGDAFGGLFHPRSAGFQKVLHDKALLRDLDKIKVPYYNIANPLAAEIVTSGIRPALYDFRDSQQVVDELTDERDDAIDERDDKLAEVNALVDLINRLQVGGDPAVRAQSKAQLPIKRTELAALQKNLDDLEALVEAATVQNAAVNVQPFLPEPGTEGPGRAALFQLGGTQFTGTCTFGFPSATFLPTNLNANAFWRAVAAGTGHTDVNANMFVAAACTPLMFPRYATGANEGLLPRAGVVSGAAHTVNVTPQCIFDVAAFDNDPNTGTVTCNYDFTNSLSSAGSYNATTNNENNIGWFAGGYSLLLGRQEGVKSNMLASYVTEPNIVPAATRQELRDVYGNKFVIGNRVPLTHEQFAFTYNAGRATGATLYNIFFATKKVPERLIFVSSVHNHRKYMMILSRSDRDYSARMEYTTAGGGAINQIRCRIDFDETPLFCSVPDGAGNFVPGEGQTQLLMQAMTTAANVSWDMILPDSDFVEQNKFFSTGPYVQERALTLSRGAVWNSRKRISQHVCGPILNPNLRIGAVAPLNYDSRHLPPELRDFRLQMYDVDWSRLQAEKVTLNELTLYEFKDGTQKVGALESVLYLPQFREFKSAVAGNTFEMEVYSELGAPSYFCIFCRRRPEADILQQPIIKTLSIFNGTTKKKSNVVQDMRVSQLFHLTQRNVHPASQYGRQAFNRRQTILLSTEDIGMMGLKSDEYQKAKRVRYVFSGTTNEPGQLHVVLVYNNRGLHIDGRRLQVVTLHE